MVGGLRDSAQHDIPSRRMPRGARLSPLSDQLAQAGARMMSDDHEPTGRLLFNIRKKRRDKAIYLAALVGVTTSSIACVEAERREVPVRWLSLLPEEYR